MKFFKLMKEQGLLADVFNVVLGLVVIVLFVLFILNPKNLGLMAALMMCAGVMNLSNSYRRYKQKVSMTRVVLLGASGVVMIAIGVYYIRLALI